MLCEGVVAHLPPPTSLRCALAPVRHTRSEARLAGFLLEVVAVLSGIGIKVKSAHVRTCAECSEDATIKKMLSQEDAQIVKNARIMQFQVLEGDGTPLTERSVHAVLFTLGLVGPTRQQDTVVPSLRSYASKFSE